MKIWLTTYIKACCNNTKYVWGGEWLTLVHGWFPSLLTSSHWEPVLSYSPCCSIVLSYGWMGQRAAREAEASSIMYYILLVHLLPLHSVSPNSHPCILRQRDRPAGRNAHCSLGASIDPANHFIYCLINADSHLYSRRSRPRSIRVWLTACLAECMFDWKRMKRTKHTLVHTHIHRD